MSERGRANGLRGVARVGDVGDVVFEDVFKVGVKDTEVAELEVDISDEEEDREELEE